MCVFATLPCKKLYRFFNCCTSIFPRISSVFSSEKHSLFDPAELLATSIENTSEVSNDDEDSEKNSGMICNAFPVLKKKKPNQSSI